jgi:Flp pilus assembly protein TadG
MRERGETLIEFALSLVVFLMILLGLSEFGILVFRYNMLADLAQEGARRGSVCGSGAAPSLDCSIESYVATRSLGILSSSDVTVTWSAGSAAASIPGDTVTVSVSRPFNPMTRLVPLSPLTITSSAQMIISR